MRTILQLEKAIAKQFAESFSDNDFKFARLVLKDAVTLRKILNEYGIEPDNAFPHMLNMFTVNKK